MAEVVTAQEACGDDADYQSDELESDLVKSVPEKGFGCLAFQSVHLWCQSPAFSKNEKCTLP